MSYEDIRKFKLAVAQTCDSIQAAADWIERDSKDVEKVSYCGIKHVRYRTNIVLWVRNEC